MWEWLEQLRAKPESVRRKVAVVTAGSLTVLVIVFWILLRFVTPDPEPYLGKEDPSVTSLKGNLEELKETAGQGAAFLRGLGDAFGSVKSE